MRRCSDTIVRDYLRKKKHVQKNMSHFHGSGSREFYEPHKHKKKKKIIIFEHAYLDIVEREQPNHGVVLPFVPIFVDLLPDKNDVTFPERQFSVRAHQNVIKYSICYWLALNLYYTT